jgi:hypothetical protein
MEQRCHNLFNISVIGEQSHVILCFKAVKKNLENPSTN